MSFDTKSFHENVLCKGADSLLPCNMDDDWLHEVSSLLDDVLEEPTSSSLNTSLMIISTILMAKTKSDNPIQLTDEELFDYLQKYQLELAMEVVSRTTEMEFQAATLDSIFTNRPITAVNTDFKK